MFGFAYFFAIGALFVGAAFMARRGRRNALPEGAPSRGSFSVGEWRVLLYGFGLMIFSSLGGALWLLF